MVLNDGMSNITFDSEKEATTVLRAIQSVVQAYMSDIMTPSEGQNSEDQPTQQEVDILMEFVDYLELVVSMKHLNESIVKEYEELLEDLEFKKILLDQAYDEDAPIDD